jgi:hypothetical protein
MNYIKTLFTGSILSGTLASNIKELFTDRTTPTVNEQVEDSNVPLVQNCTNSVIKKTSQDGNNLKVKRKSKKVLTTCKVCGHYRFARKNSKRIINSSYPYEHSPRGGCKVLPQRYIPEGKKLRRLCLCTYCKEAAAAFNHHPPSNKKQRQYNYSRTPEQELVWSDLKTKGWYCRKGRYFSPGMKYKFCDGLEPEHVF